MITFQASLRRSKPLYEQTYTALRSAILVGEIRAGERLIETQLAEKLKVSRTPIREALRRLQQESLLTTDPDGGIYVVRLSLNDAIRLYECRVALEQVAVAGACKYATEPQLQTIETALLQEEEITSTEMQKINSTQLLDLNCNFHRQIAIASDNPWLLPLLDQVTNQITLLRIQTLQWRSEVLNIHSEHYRIYEAIAQRHVELAVQYMTEHLTVSQNRIVQIFEQVQASNPLQDESVLQQAGVKCPNCGSVDLSKNGRRLGKQNYLCKACGRQFLESHSRVGYSAKVKQECLSMHTQGLGYREIERRTGVNHNTIIRWVNQFKQAPSSE